jgi:hypothetical protein
MFWLCLKLKFIFAQPLYCQNCRLK